MPVLPEQTAGAEPSAGSHLSLGQEGGGREALWVKGLGRNSRSLEPRSFCGIHQESKEAEWGLGQEPELENRSLQPEMSPSGPWIHAAGPLLLLLAHSTTFPLISLLSTAEVGQNFLKQLFLKTSGTNRRMAQGRYKKERKLFGKTQILHLLDINEAF